MRCFHCNEPVPPGSDFHLNVGGKRRALCCPGCLAVARLIDAQGLERFYEFRVSSAVKPEEYDPSKWLVCDRAEVERRLSRRLADGRREFRCRVGGINCAACAWLIDRGLRSLDGVDEVSVNPVSGETSIRYHGSELKPSQLLNAIAELGFTPQPSLAAGDNGSRADRSELKRLAVAGLGFAQVMTLSAALYLGAFKSMQASFTSFFMLASLLVATPVVLYSGAPIFRAAWHALAERRVGMDVPVSLAIGFALGASLYNVWRGAGDVYFDSATMFVFFLTLGRFLESRARHKAASVFSALNEIRPIGATRASGERVGTIELGVGDEIVVAPGETVPADAELLSPQGRFDESLLSGEATGQRKRRGSAVLGGSLNAGNEPVSLRVTRIGAESYVERVGSMLQAAIDDRPEFLGVADRWAQSFVAGLLVLTAGVGSVWTLVAPERAFEVVLAMLVVTCPCALSLAAPTAFAVALGSLANTGLLLRSARALERLRDVSLWLFDKTGTLTEGKIGIAGVTTYGELDEAACLRLAAALEANVEHPIAEALRQPDASEATQVLLSPGYGVTGCVEGLKLRLGSARYVGLDAEDDAQCVYLADQSRALARIELEDQLRPHAREALASLAAAGAELMLVSGDAPRAVANAAGRLGLAEFRAAQDPGDKLGLQRRRQRAGDVVAAVGDGINDAPLLAQADVSVAMVTGSRLAQASADVVFTGNDLRKLAELPRYARVTRRVVRQNLIWATFYNMAAIPLAATGVLAPWMAALGMSLSSVLVVGNALRLRAALEVASEAEAPEPGRIDLAAPETP